MAVESRARGGTMNCHSQLDLSVGSHRETSHNYGRVLLKNGRWRIAVCRNDRQWLLQQRVTIENCAGARWRNKGYCLSRESLILLQHRLSVGVWPELEMLPERFVPGSIQ